MPIAKLIFFPANTDQPVNNTILLDTLIQQQFIIATAYAENHFLPGDNFLSLLTFLGCSPNINLSPEEGEDHCSISLIPSSETIEYLGRTPTIHPKCPLCKKRIANWKTESWKSTGSICICDKCQTPTPYADLNWKHECGFARGGFIVSHIYPHEALPTEQLLSRLKQATHFDCDYCYTNE